MLPTSYTFLPELLDVDPVPFALGDYGAQHHGTLNGARVCVKRLRVYRSDSSPAAVARVRYHTVASPAPHHPQRPQMFCRDAVTWKSLNHPNVVPFVGVVIKSFQLITMWMPGGTLPEYIRKRPNPDLVGLVGSLSLRFLPH